MIPAGRPAAKAGATGATGGPAGGPGPAAGGTGRAVGASGSPTVRGREDLPKGLAAELAGWAWRLDAACGGLPSSMFFSPEGERGAARRRRERTAKAVCGSCVVREHCAAYALAYKERYGVWGGLSEHEREAIWYRRARQPAPRHHESTNRQGGKAP